MVLSRMKKPDESEAAKEEKLTDSEQLISTVNKAVTSVTSRLNSLAHFDGLDSKVSIMFCSYSLSYLRSHFELRIYQSSLHCHVVCIIFWGHRNAYI